MCSSLSETENNSTYYIFGMRVMLYRIPVYWLSTSFIKYGLVNITIMLDIG